MNDTKFAITNYAGCTVSCSKSQWDSHIVYEHAIMEDNCEAVKDTLKAPDSVYQSSQNASREIYFKASSLSTYKLKTKVIVEYSPGKKDPTTIVGEVVTAFPQKEEKGGIGDVVYKRTSD
ncbi:MAG: hypothetical protein NC429_14705 [Lachnospiraceae bacterium]|nr:hypothetical protein [Lachnospiraceae bacterium]